eukprot:1766904-Rhodomonas_salina.1
MCERARVSLCVSVSRCLGVSECLCLGVSECVSVCACADRGGGEHAHRQLRVLLSLGGLRRRSASIYAEFAAIHACDAVIFGGIAAIRRVYGADWWQIC